MSYPIEKIGHALVVFATDYQRMAGAAFIIKIRKNFDVNLDLIRIQMNIVW